MSGWPRAPIARRPLAATTGLAMAVASVLVFGACGASPTNGSGGGDAGQAGTTAPSTTEPRSGATLSALDARDRSPLPAGAFLSFQSISRTPDPDANHRWILSDDGSLRIVFHSGDPSATIPFDRPLPGEPTRSLAAAEVDELRNLLVEHRFAELPQIVRGPGEAEGGMWQVVRARVGGVEHEVVFDGARHPVADRLQRVASHTDR